MQILFNQTPTEIPPGCSISDLLLLQNVSTSFMAVAVNLSVIPKHQWAQTRLREGDKVTVIGAAKGG